ncbi:hypothetical protein GCM10010169_53580 [Micromonospora fulviviridis]|nr:hypothetical protein GCM10010169_53580 [Micromonospora fulviviridis]
MRASFAPSVTSRSGGRLPPPDRMTGNIIHNPADGFCPGPIKWDICPDDSAHGRRPMTSATSRAGVGR